METSRIHYVANIHFSERVRLLCMALFPSLDTE